MKFGLISLGSKSSEMLAQAARFYFDEVQTLDLKKIEVQLGKEGGIFYQGKPLDDFDCVYVKGSFRYAQLLQSIAAMLEGRVPYMPLPATSFNTIHNKLLTHLVLQQHNIPMPTTYIPSTTEAARALLKQVSYPIVMKFPEGTQGKGVMFADSFSSASSLLDALGALNQPFIIQEYIETGGADIRVIVVGDKIVAAMRRQAQKEEKRANIHAGGVGLQINLSREVISCAIAAAQALQVDICGIDILEGPRGPMVIEANISPGLQGISSVATVDVASEIAKFLASRTAEKVGIHRSKRASEMIEAMSKEAELREPGREIMTKLTFRGERILLPEFVTVLSGFSDRKEYVVKADKGRIEVFEKK